jgi:hypothetical protein
MRLMMSAVRELVHDVLDLRAEGETEGERDENFLRQQFHGTGRESLQQRMNNVPGRFRSKSGKEERRTGKDFWTSESGPV